MRSGRAWRTRALALRLQLAVALHCARAAYCASRMAWQARWKARLLPRNKGCRGQCAAAALYEDALSGRPVTGWWSRLKPPGRGQCRAQQAQHCGARPVAVVADGVAEARVVWERRR